MKTKKTIGLALGSGAFRGFSHIGVLKVLEKHHIPIDYLSGSSIGAWVAAHYAIFKDAQKLEKEILANSRERWESLVDLTWRGGFISGDKVFALLKKNLHQKTFAKLKIPLRIVATDLISGRPVIFKQGDLAQAVRASTSVPLVFKPLAYKNKLLVDGALSDPVPSGLVKEMGADIVISVNLYNKHEFVKKDFNVLKVMLRSVRIAVYNLAKISEQTSDIVINLDDSKFIADDNLKKYLDPATARKMIAIGERATEKVIPQLKKLLK
ncbi:MAG: patatin-like phospholipase family protein [Patescibacteria group bacterium]